MCPNVTQCYTLLVKYLYFSNLSSELHLAHFVATREAGNVSFSVGDDPKKVLINRENIAKDFGVSLDAFTVAGLVHGNHVVKVSAKTRGRGSTSPQTVIPETDAMITNTPDILLMVPVADCVPILFFDPIKKAIGIAHAGWRGTLKEIAKATVNKLHQEFNCNASDIKVGIGPAICVRHYEVDEAVLPGARGNFDLVAANKIQLLDTGVKPQNIEIMPYCTFERTDLFYSHRAEKSTGRFATGIILL